MAGKKNRKKNKIGKNKTKNGNRVNVKINLPKRRFPRKRRRGNRGRRLALAQNNLMRKFFKVIRSDQNSMVVSGLDQVYPIPDKRDAMSTKVLCVIPANPVYWLGTRIGALALGYQLYRPLNFRIHYVPSVSAMQGGNVIGGTIWGSNTPNENGIQQSLSSSSGYLSTQVFQPKSATVECKTFLQYNLFNIGGPLDDKSNPFYYIAISIGNLDENGNRVLPGYFYVSYTYVFKNPIGMNQIFNTPGLIQYKDIDWRLNTTAVICSEKEDSDLDLFTRVDIERTELGDIECRVNGTYVELKNDTWIWVFQNFDARKENAFGKKRTINFHTTTSLDQELIPEYITLNKGDALVYLLEERGDLTFAMFISRADNYRYEGNWINDWKPDHNGVTGYKVIRYNQTENDFIQFDQLEVNSVNVTSNASIRIYWTLKVEDVQDITFNWVVQE